MKLRGQRKNTLCPFFGKTELIIRLLNADLIYAIVQVGKKFSQPSAVC